MNKRKILMMALTLCMVAIIAVGGSLAYFVDSDSKDNVFTVGNVTIDLWENFDLEDKDGIEELAPVTYDEEGNRKDDNVIQKEIYVTNTGASDAYVRIHFAIPTLLDSGDDDNPAFAAYDNILHWNFSLASTQNNQWNWNVDRDGAGYPGNGGTWNTYTETIDGIEYTVYVATHMAALTSDQTTENAVHSVYMDVDVTNQVITELKETLGEQWHIYVVAEGCQTTGFADAYEALNVSFGVPGTYDVEWAAETIGDRDWTLGENS